MARHMLVLRPRRSAWLGFSSMRTRSGAWRISTRSFELGPAREQRLQHGLVAMEDEVHGWMAHDRPRQGGHDNAGAGIAAHGIDRNRQFAAHPRLAAW